MIILLALLWIASFAGAFLLVIAAAAKAEERMVMGACYASCLGALTLVGLWFALPLWLIGV